MMDNKMINTTPTTHGGKCSDAYTCPPQREYKTKSMGKFKVKFQNGVTYCFFCDSDFKSRMFMEGINTK